MNYDLMMAVLAMDAYTPHSVVGLATNLNIALPSGSGGFGFSAVAYTYNGDTVISYRGTDSILSDVFFGWGEGVGVETTQAGLAAIFYKSVVHDAFPYASNGMFTGHSLGGGLTGLMASL